MSAVRDRALLFVDWMAGAPAGHFLARRALAMPVRERLAWLKAHPDGARFHTLNALLDIADERVDDEPGLSIALSEVVLQMLDQEPRGAFPDPFREHVRGRAWLEHARALRPAGDLLAAHRAYQKAGDIFASEGTGELELAAAKRGEALVCALLGDSETALRMLYVAMAVCEGDGDVAGVARCRWYEGIIDFEKDRLHAAAAKLENALLLATRGGDELTIARVRLSLGHCAMGRGDHAAARRELLRALEFFDRAGMRIDQQRVAWAMARMAGDDGFVEGSIAVLDHVAREMESAGLIVDAALARRDIVELLVLADHPRLAAELARGVLETLARAGLFREALWTAILLQQAESGTALGADQS